MARLVLVSAYIALAVVSSASAQPTLRTTLDAHSDIVFYGIAFSPDGKTLAAASRDNTGRLWNVSTGESYATLRHTNEVRSVAFSPDGRILASGGLDETIRLWDVRTGKGISVFKGTDWISSIAFRPDGKTLASGQWDNRINLWEVATGRKTATLRRDDLAIIHSVVFSPDGKLLAAALGNQAGPAIASDGPFPPPVGSGVQAERAADGRPRLSPATASGKGNPGTITIPLLPAPPVAPEGLAGNGTPGAITTAGITLWDVAGGKQRAFITPHAGPVRSVSFSPDGKTLVSGSFGIKNTIEFWDVVTGKNTLSLNAENVNSVAFSPDGKTLASGNGDSTVSLWDVATGRNTAILRGHLGFVSVAFSPAGKILAVANWDGTVKLWNLDLRVNGDVPCRRTRKSQGGGL